MTSPADNKAGPTGPGAWARRAAAVMAAAALLAAAGFGARALEKATRPGAPLAEGALRASGVPAPPDATPLSAHADKASAVARFLSPDDPDSLLAFYRTAMKEAGWRQLECADEDLGGDILAFARRPRLCIISLGRSTVQMGTVVTIFVSQTTESRPPGPPYEETRP